MKTMSNNVNSFSSRMMKKAVEESPSSLLRHKAHSAGRGGARRGPRGRCCWAAWTRTRHCTPLYRRAGGRTNGGFGKMCDRCATNEVVAAIRRRHGHARGVPAETAATCTVPWVPTNPCFCCEPGLSGVFPVPPLMAETN